MENANKKLVLNKLVGNIIASAVIDSEDITLILKKFFESERAENSFDEHILVNSCVVKLNNTITVKTSVSVDSRFFSLPILNIIENDLNTYVEYDIDEVNVYMNKIDEIVDYIITP